MKKHKILIISQDPEVHHSFNLKLKDLHERGPYGSRRAPNEADLMGQEGNSLEPRP